MFHIDGRFCLNLISWILIQAAFHKEQLNGGREQIDSTMEALSTAAMGSYLDKLGKELYKFLDYKPLLILFCYISLIELTIHFGNIGIIYDTHQNEVSHGAQGSMKDSEKYISSCQPDISPLIWCQISH